MSSKTKRPLTSKERDRLVKLLGMLGSEHAGERAVAGLKAHELINECLLTWGDVIVGAEQKTQNGPFGGFGHASSSPENNWYDNKAGSGQGWNYEFWDFATKAKQQQRAEEMREHVRKAAEAHARRTDEAWRRAKAGDAAWWDAAGKPPEGHNVTRGEASIIASRCLDCAIPWNEWVKEFLQNMQVLTYDPTPKQTKKLVELNVHRLYMERSRGEKHA
jgi:hypothetical protein